MSNASHVLEPGVRAAAEAILSLSCASWFSRLTPSRSLDEVPAADFERIAAAARVLLANVESAEDAAGTPKTSARISAGYVVAQLPGRLRAAAAAVAKAHAARGGEPDVADALDRLAAESPDVFDALLESVTAALDAADEASPAAPHWKQSPPDHRISLAATVGLDLGAQAVVLLDVAKDGTVTVSTFAAGAGTPARAIAEWARGLESSGLSAVPFQTVFGWGFGGKPTPLTLEQLDGFGEAGRLFALRNTVTEDSEP